MVSRLPNLFHARQCFDEKKIKNPFQRVILEIVKWLTVKSFGTLQGLFVTEGHTEPGQDVCLLD
jgi:hypothetical protein